MDRDTPELVAELRRVGLTAGLDAVGVTTAAPLAEARVALEERRAAGLHGGMQFTYRNPARSTEPQRALPGARSLVVGALGYRRGPDLPAPDRPAPDRLAPDRPAPARPAPGQTAPDPLVPGQPASGADRLSGADQPSGPDRPSGRVARYAWEDYYGRLRTALTEVAEVLRAGGHRAVVLADDNALVDRAAAVRAGIGWYGNNTTVLVPGVGSWCVLGAVITDAPLAGPDPREPVGSCGTCRRCLPACPTGALVAPGVLDARRCLAWIVQAPGAIPREFREAVGDRMYGCDDCQDACPVNRVTLRRSRHEPSPEPAAASVDVLELLAATDEEILARWGRWYIAERNPRYLRRNALVVLGNTAGGSEPAVTAALAAALASPDPLLRAHGAWAAARLGRTDLLAAVAADDDPLVRAELADRPAPRPSVHAGAGVPTGADARAAAGARDLPAGAGDQAAGASGLPAGGMGS